MCEDCGCQEANEKHFHDSSNSRTVEIETNVLKENNHLAHHNHHWFHDNNVKVLNMMSSPGTGKTALLEKTINTLSDEKKITILVGDQQTDHDAERLLNSGGNVKQINTHSSCHLDARMISRELGGFVSGEEDILVIENIGNLVCPAAFDLGENIKVALLSTTEGEDKPVKYPVLFNKANLIIITKIDLMPHLDWSLEKTKNYIRQVNPNAKIIALSAKSGEGMNEWVDYLKGL
ncbi:MAG: hydrogenase nickel incorporation protein HypB [Bacteriovoracaceae bacterium]|nr:hydrogenase nickel incorporation protein HypB [Bacteriovoracaceae bacterium]